MTARGARPTGRDTGRRHISPFVADALLVAVLLLLAIFEYTHTGDDGHRAGPFALNGPLTLAELVPLAWRRRAPIRAFAIAYAVVIVPSLFVDHTEFAYTGTFPLAFYLYTVARHCDDKRARWALLGPPIALVAESIHAPVVRTASNIVFALLLFSIAWFIGRVLRRQALQRAALAAALAQLGLEQEQQEHLAILDERANLARDLHDVVAHAVALMLVQAGAARLAADHDLEAARAGLLAVERTGREATADLRRLLGLLRASDEPTSLQPAPGLDGVRNLVEQIALAGVDVELDIIGEPTTLPPSLNMSAFRVVQEALTNVLKHAGPTHVVVRIDYTGPLTIEVIDDGPRGRPPDVEKSGHGLVGMNERVVLYGGTMRAARQDAGFAVRVELPLQLVST